MFLNKEAPISFIKYVNVVCTAALKLKDMMTTAGYAFFEASGEQGWAYVRTRDGDTTDFPTDEAVIGKLELDNLVLYDGCRACKDECAKKCWFPSSKMCSGRCSIQGRDACKYQNQ